MASIDILEQSIKNISYELLKLLLVDKTTKGYIRWGTNQYYRHGADYRAEKEIFPHRGTGTAISWSAEIKHSHTFGKEMDTI